jgi:preprotein translocase subunit SecA
MGLFSFFSSDNSRSIKKLEKTAKLVEDLSDKYKNMTDSELRATTGILKERLSKGETLNDILPDAYAVVREASTRVLNMRHFHVQIMGGIALHQGRIAQMRTGEGKTLVATLPAYLNALAGKGVHIVTVNEYLTKTQAEWMGRVYNFLGLTVGINLSGMSDEDKRKAYDCDITYTTNNELGFDYLRDNMVVRKDRRVQRGFNFAIVDEVDSILIDEARTPLIISGPGMKSSEQYVTADKFAKSLLPEDYEIQPKEKTIILTATGITKAEKYFKVENLSDVDNIELNHHINNALRAEYIMKLDSNYIVKDNEVIIVDEFTGRLMPGRRYSDGLHQAIEAKEGVKIQDENKTLATITFQNFFRLYHKLSGMTGTAKTEEVEFNKIYDLDVVVIPTNLPMIRVDEPDIIYKTEKAKVNAVVEEIKRLNEKGQPVLVGTVTIDKSEEISKALRAAKIKHNVLNAKNHELEGELVAQAGRKGAVTIATNMAGRGTDILLGGNPEFLAKKKLKELGYSDEQIYQATSIYNDSTAEIKEIAKLYRQYFDEFKKITDEEKQEVIALGGLRIIGTERHESRRIDDQLRGRAGRQGDKGSSVFYISLEDDLIRRFGGEMLMRIANSFKIDDDVPFQVKMLSKSIESAQKKIEAQNFAIRRNLLEYDDVMNKQRMIIYGQRNAVLDGKEMGPEIADMYKEVVNDLITETIDSDKPYFDWDLKAINDALEARLLDKGTNLITEDFVSDCEVKDVCDKVYKYVQDMYNKKVADAKEIGFNFSELERVILLKVVDTLWMDQIDEMTVLKNEIGLRAYGNRDPLVAYKEEGFEMFDSMIKKIRQDTCTVLLHINVEKVQMNPVVNKEQPIVTNKVDSADKAPETSKKVVNRNDPCPCGSGKKYKNCCGKNAK